MSLQNSAATGIRWTSLSMLLVTIIQIIRLLLLGRLLGPEEFGLMAMMLVITGFAEILGQMGLNEAIIQHHNSTSHELSTLYWLNVILGGLLYFIMTFFAPLIADIYSTPILEEMLCWVALTFIISPWGSQFRARFQKHLNFKPLAIVDILAVTTGSLLSVSLAWIGLGVWALI